MGWQRRVDLTSVKQPRNLLGNMVAVPCVGIVQLAILCSGIELWKGPSSRPSGSGLAEASLSRG
eukprot:4771591-Pyramimonas_sp.AAC.1